MKPTINSTKTIYQSTPFTVAAAAIGIVQPLVGKDAADVNITGEVVAGAVVKAIYCEYWVTTDGAGQGSVILTVEIRSAASSAMTYADAAGLDSYANKNRVLFTTQGLTPGNTENPQNFVRQWIKIPKGMQRFKKDDVIVINVASPTGGVAVCGFSLYKAYN